MAKDNSFDLVSEYDLSAVINATEQAKREIATRYDFNGTGSKLEFDRDKHIIELESGSEVKLEAMIDVLKSKFIRAELDLKFLDTSAEVTQNNMVSRKTITLVKGLDQTKAKQISAIIRENFPKAKSQIQGEAVRVSSGSRDELQQIMAKLRASDLDFPLSFTNFR